MSIRNVVYFTRLTTKNESTKRSRGGSVLTLIVPLCALLAVMLNVSAPTATHAASALPCASAGCGNNIPAELAECYADPGTRSDSYPMTNTGSGPTLSHAYTFYSPRCDGYWVEIENQSDQRIEGEAGVDLYLKPLNPTLPLQVVELGSSDAVWAQSGSSIFSHLVKTQDIQDTALKHANGINGNPPSFSNPVSITGYAKDGRENGVYVDQWYSTPVSITVSSN